MKTYSQSPQAIRKRARRLLEPGFSDQENAGNARRRAKRKETKVAQLRDLYRCRKDLFTKQVAHHLSRGRDSGRIAVWLNEPESRVLDAIAEIRAKEVA